MTDEPKVSRLKRGLWLVGGMLLVFVLFAMAVSMVDVREVGPMGATVGFATVNVWWRDLIGVSGGWEAVSDVLLGVMILVMVGFFIAGLYQLVRRRSIFKVDVGILALGVTYIVMLLAYFLLNAIGVNYRPVLDDGELAVSFPSSHTLLAVTVMVTAAIFWMRKISDKVLRRVVIFVLFGLMAVLVVARVLAGVHWLTDIVGGVVLGGGMICFYSFFREWIAGVIKARRRA